MKAEDILTTTEQQPEPEWLEHLSVLKLEKGDLVVIRVQRRISRDACERIKACAAAALSITGERILVLEEGMELGVLRGTADA